MAASKVINSTKFFALVEVRKKAQNSKKIRTVWEIRASSHAYYSTRDLWLQACKICDPNGNKKKQQFHWAQYKWRYRSRALAQKTFLMLVLAYGA